MRRIKLRDQRIQKYNFILISGFLPYFIPIQSRSYFLSTYKYVTQSRYYPKSVPKKNSSNKIFRSNIPKPVQRECSYLLFAIYFNSLGPIKLEAKLWEEKRKRNRDYVGLLPHSFSMMVVDCGHPEEVNTLFKTIKHARRLWS